MKYSTNHSNIKIRKILLKKTGGKCFYCGEKIDINKAQIDHVVAFPVNNDIKNLVISCPYCNAFKWNYSLAEWRLKVKKKVLKFKRNLNIYIKLTDLIKQEDDEFLTNIRKEITDKLR